MPEYANQRCGALLPQTPKTSIDFHEVMSDIITEIRHLIDVGAYPNVRLFTFIYNLRVISEALDFYEVVL